MDKLTKINNQIAKLEKQKVEILKKIPMTAKEAGEYEAQKQLAKELAILEMQQEIGIW